jgi:hypothetical protein
MKSGGGIEMKRRGSRLRAVPVLAALVAGVAEPASAQYSLSWLTIDCGGVMQSAGGTYTLGGTIGQPDAGALSGGAYSLSGGFWVGGTSAVVGVAENGPVAPAGPRPLTFRFNAPAPNPVVRQTTLAFDLPEPRRVSARVYDVAGRLTRTLVDGPLPAGRHSQVWDATNENGRRVSTGIYFVVLEAGNDRGRQKVLVLR